MLELRLLCFPPTGSNAQTFDLWQSYLPAWIDVQGMDYPGHGRRATEPLVASIETLAQILAARAAPSTSIPYALLGHSLGALVAYEVAHALTRAGQPPVHLFALACRPPRHRPRQVIHDLPDQEFSQRMRTRLRDFKGPFERLDLALLRADVTAAETYADVPSRALDCPLTVLGASGDRLLPRAKLADWCLNTTGRFTLEILDCQHSFISQLDGVAARVARELSGVVREPVGATTAGGAR